MIRRTIAAAIAFGLLASAPAGARERSCGDADERISVQRDDPFFTVEHPPRGETTLSSGHVVPIPFPVYQADISVIYGLVDATAVRRIMAGTGHEPVTTQGRAIARLFVWELDTALGPYEELAVAFDSSTEKIAVPWSGPYSTFAPTLDPRTTFFMHELILDRWPSIYWGREFLGFDKSFGCISIDRAGHALTGTTRSFDVRDSRGRAVLSGTLNEPDMAMSVAFAPHRLAETLGVESPAYVPSVSPEAVVGGVSRDVMTRGSTVKYNVVEARMAGVVTEFAGDLAIGRRSAIGRELRRMGFEPTVVYRDPNMMFVMDLAADGTPLIP